MIGVGVSPVALSVLGRFSGSAVPAAAIAVFGALDADGGTGWAYRTGGSVTPLTTVTLSSGSLGSYTPAISNGRLTFTGGGRGAPDGVVLTCEYLGGSIEVTTDVQADSYALRDVRDTTDLRQYAELNTSATIIPIYFNEDLWESVGRKSTNSLIDARAEAEAGTTPGLNIGGGDVVTLTGDFVGDFEDYILHETLAVVGFSGKIANNVWEREEGGPGISWAIDVYNSGWGEIDVEDNDFLAPDLEPTYGSGMLKQRDGEDAGNYRTTNVNLRRNRMTASSADPLKLAGGGPGETQVVLHNYFGPPALLQGKLVGDYDSERGYALNEFVNNSGGGGRYQAIQAVPAGIAPPMDGTSTAYWQWRDPHGDSPNPRASVGGIAITDNVFDGLTEDRFPNQHALPNNTPRTARNGGGSGTHPMLKIAYKGCHFPRSRNGENAAPAVGTSPTYLYTSGVSLLAENANTMETCWIGCKADRAPNPSQLGLYVYGGDIAANNNFLGNRCCDTGSRLADIDKIDATAPSFASGSPADDATAVAVDTDVVVTFSEDVMAGSGTFTIYDIDGAAAFETFTVGGAGDNGGTISIGGTDVTLSPGADLDPGTSYAIQWSAGAVDDLAGNAVSANAGTTLLNFGTAAPSAPISAVSADGWQSTYDGTPPAEMDPVGSPETFTVSHDGFNAAGGAITVDDTITLMKRVREPYPSQASLTALMVALSDFVYSADAIAGVTNNSTRAYPKPQAMWATLDYARATMSSFDVRMVVTHAHARQGRPVAAVKFTASDGTNTAEVTVSSMTPVSYSATGLTVPLFEGTLDLSGLDEGLVTVDATIYPWVGDAFTISTDAVASASSTINLCPLTILNDRAGGIGTAYAYVDDTTGDDGTGVVSETPATAAANPYATASAAVTALTSYNNANFGRNDAGGAVLRFNDGTHTLGSIKGAAGSNNYPLYVEGESEAGTFVQDAGSSTQNSIPHFIHFQDLTFQKTGDYIFLDNGTGGTVSVMTLKNVTCEVLAAGGYGAWFYRVGRLLLENVTEGGYAGAGFSTVSKHLNAIGSDIGGGDRVYNAAGCAGFQISLKKASGNLVDGEGQCFMHNTISRGDTGQVCVDVSGAIGARGIAIVGNVVEKWGGDTTPAVQINADGNGSETENVVYFGNTVVGSRTNFGYLDTNGMTNVDKSGYRRFNVEYLRNTKGDVFATDGNLVGNWPIRFNVGSRANVALEGSNNGSGHNASNWIGEVAALGDLVGSSGTPVDPDWTDDASYQGTGLGGGDYSPGALTELPTIPAGLAPYSHDLTGNTLADNGSDYVGAVAA